MFCYLTSWSAKRPGAGKFEPKDIDAKLCTHIVYAFATLKDNKLTEANEDDPENYDKLVELREKNPDLQVEYPPPGGRSELLHHISFQF